MDRLSRATLERLPASVERPRYDLEAARAGIVHLGIGAFHRAHQAVYLDDRLAAGELDWAVLGASLRSPETRDALAPQDGLYTLLVRSREGVRARVVGALRGVLVAPEDPGRLIAAMGDPGVRVVSLTITEKGYCHDPATGELQEGREEVRRDLADPARPGTALGFLVEALRARREAGIAPFTVLCCDNLPANGETVRRVVSRFAALRDPDLGAFVAGEVAFPSTMVDRIVPAATPADREDAAGLCGLDDAWPVSTEPFTQWVIEDRFPSGRPRLEEAGAQLVSDVAPFETMKLRLLNGTHSMMAYLGYLAGYETIAQTIADPAFATLVRAAMEEEIAPTLHVPPGADLGAYQTSLMARYANPALRHRTWQIAMDGTQKLPQRLLGTIRDRLAAGAPFPRLALAVAGWMRYASGVDENGRPIDVRDPLAPRLASLAAAAEGSPERLFDALIGIEAVFGTDLARDPRFRAPVLEALRALCADGAAASVRARAV